MKRVLQNFFFEPRVAFCIFVVFILVYLVILDEEGAFTKKFLSFGPSPNTTFLHMKLDTWHKVYIVYALGFFSSLLTTYYNTVSYVFIHSSIWNPSYTKTISISKNWAKAIVILEPLLYWILNIINLFVNLTMQLQFLIPSFLGSVIIDVPYGLFKLDKKKFIS